MSQPYGSSGILALSTGDGLNLHQTMAERVMVEIHRLIIAGEVAPGAALPIRDLADRFGTSAMPVREALRRLSALGLIEIVPHKGARVSEISVNDLEDTYRIRLVLEPLAVATASQHLTEDQAERARAALEQNDTLLRAGDIEAARRAHTAFHFLLYQAAQSRWLLRAIEPVWQNSDRYRFLEPNQTEIAASKREHTEVLDACLSHDSAAAEIAMERHLNGALSRIRAWMLANHI